MIEFDDTFASASFIRSTTTGPSVAVAAVSVSAAAEPGARKRGIFGLATASCILLDLVGSSRVDWLVYSVSEYPHEAHGPVPATSSRLARLLLADKSESPRCRMECFAM